MEKINFSLPEKGQEKNQKEKKLEQLNDFLKLLSENFKKENLPVKENCRIDSEKFIGIYSQTEIKKDKEEVLKKEKEWFQEENEIKIEEKRRKKEGEQLEMVKTAVLNKFLKERYCILRASLYDDIFNKVDNVICDKKTGEVICALDEVEDINGEKFKEKKEKILKKNQKGVELKYGLEIKNNQVFLKKISNLPIFYLALPPQYLEKCLLNFEPDLEKQTECEKMFFHFFITLIEKETKEIFRQKIEIEQKTLEKIENLNRNLKKFKNKDE